MKWAQWPITATFATDWAAESQIHACNYSNRLDAYLHHPSSGAVRAAEMLLACWCYPVGGTERFWRVAAPPTVSRRTNCLLVSSRVDAAAERGNPMTVGKQRPPEAQHLHGSICCSSPLLLSQWNCSMEELRLMERGSGYGRERRLFEKQCTMRLRNKTNAVISQPLHYSSLWLLDD
jgi:hypothetical protein